MVASKNHVVINKEIFEKLNISGRLVLGGGGGLINGILVDPTVIKTLDTAALKQHGFQVVLVPAAE